MKLVYIEWIDAHGVEPNWEWMDELLAKVDYVCVTKSVGWLIKENKKQVVVLPHWIEANKDTRAQGCGEMTIPKANISRMVVLTVPRGKIKGLGRPLAAPRRRLKGKVVPDYGHLDSLLHIGESVKPNPL